MIRQVFDFKEISTVYEATGGAATLEFFKALPGAAVAEPGADLSLPVTTTRQTKTHQLGYVGAIYKVKYSPNAAGVLKLYEATMQVRVIGVYLDGAQGDVWESAEIALGI